MELLVKHLGIFVVLDNPEPLAAVEERLALGRHLDDTIVLNVLGKVIGEHALTNHGQEELLVAFLGTAEHLQLIVLISLNLGRSVTHHYMGDVFGLETFTQRQYRVDGSTHFLTCFNALLGLEAVVTVATVILVVGLAKVMQQ